MNLHEAARLGDVSELETLLNSGLSANTRDEWNATPLHWAACRGRIDACTLLLDHGADVQATDDTRGATPLHWAAAEGATDICALLLDRGADVNARDKYGRPPLHNAANENHIETLALLETRGADVNMMDATGWAPRYEHTVSGKQLYPEAIDAMGWCWGGLHFQPYMGHSASNVGDCNTSLGARARSCCTILSRLSRTPVGLAIS